MPGSLSPLEKVFKSLGLKGEVGTCPGIEGLIKETEGVIKEAEGSVAKHAAVIGCCS